MKQTVTASPRLDQIDRESFQHMIESARFQRLEERIREELERARATCERADDPIALQRAQGAVTALRMVLALPQQILREIESNLRP